MPENTAASKHSRFSRTLHDPGLNTCEVMLVPSKRYLKNQFLKTGYARQSQRLHWLRVLWISLCAPVKHLFLCTLVDLLRVYWPKDDVLNAGYCGYAKFHPTIFLYRTLPLSNLAMRASSARHGQVFIGEEGSQNGNGIHHHR